jgi:hypothetical protein
MPLAEGIDSMPDLPISEAGEAILSASATTIFRGTGESAYRKLVVSGSTPHGEVTRTLQGLTPEALFARPVKHPDEAAAALAGIWLWVDALDECHRIAQDLVTSTGSFWHAVMHRREGDFSNAKYWYRRCTGHHVMKMLGAVAASDIEGFQSDRVVARVISGGWNPDGLVDLVDAMHDKPSDPRYQVAVKLQQLEWGGLFDYCIHEAIDADRDGLDAWDKRVSAPS